MVMGPFLWYTPLGKLGEELLDLANCRRFVVPDNDGLSYSGRLIYYHSEEKDIWVRCRTTVAYRQDGMISLKSRRNSKSVTRKKWPAIFRSMGSTKAVSPWSWRPTAERRSRPDTERATLGLRGR